MKQFLVIVQIQVVQITSYTHPTFYAQDKSFNPNSNPKTPNCTICEKQVPQPLPEILPKTINERLEVCTLAFHQTNQVCNSSPRHSKNHTWNHGEP